MAAPTVLVIASGNAGKLREFSELLADLGLETRPQPEGLEVEETGNTFAVNARLKAMAVARATGCWALADDSGLSVDALGGAPGVHSARYADSDAARIARLLRELADASAATTIGGSPEATSPANRHARFTAALAVADPTGQVVLEVEGHCPGTILEAPRGAGGFGYDPVFFVPEAGLTFAEMSHGQKAELGHRGRAFAALKPQLQALLSGAAG
ncbi:MAG: RdgB/HAM1 family non-canonical purine NTP pyrophosphatase [Vulcanococcus sp.]